MIYGPLFAIFIGMITFVSSSLIVTFILLKFFYAALLAIILLLVWDILGYHVKSLIQKRNIIAVLTLNPVVLQHLLIDVHNDIFVALSIVAGYWFFLKKKYIHSMLVLGIGGFFKYIPWMLVVIPLWYYVMESTNKKRSLRNVFGIFLLLVVCGIILYAPFGLSFDVLTGVFRQLQDNNNRLTLFPGALIIDLLFSPAPLIMQMAGLALGILVLLVCLFFRKPLFAFTLPYAAMFFFTTMWFQSWYVLWIFFLLAAYVSFEVLLLTSVFMLYVSDFGEVSVMFIFLFFLGVYLWLGPRLVRMIEVALARGKKR